MRLETVDWSAVIRHINNNSDITLDEIGRTVGIAGSVLSQLYKKDCNAEARYSEGCDLIKLFYEYDGKEIPMIKRSESVTCSSCQRFRKRIDIMRIKESLYRCNECIERAKNRNGLY